ncbi:hypothetical protein C8R43DRAFT_956094 [Mycena crocata]|nr:hypothetical protein C8R43DRAFT_956094 [Mycena crocata]
MDSVQSTNIIAIHLSNDTRIEFYQHNCFQYLPSLSDETLQRIYADYDENHRKPAIIVEYLRIGIIVPANIDPRHYISVFIIPPACEEEAGESAFNVHINSPSPASAHPIDSNLTMQCQRRDIVCVAFLNIAGIYQITRLVFLHIQRKIKIGDNLLAPSAWYDRANVIASHGYIGSDRTLLECILTSGDIITVDIGADAVDDGE